MLMCYINQDISVYDDINIDIKSIGIIKIIPYTDRGKKYPVRFNPRIVQVLQNLLNVSVSIIIGPRPEYPQTTVDKVASAFELDFV